MDGYGGSYNVACKANKQDDDFGMSFIFDFFFLSRRKVGRSVQYCNRQTTRDEAEASLEIFIQVEKSV